ncbi:hypothetical protein GIB67_016299 [Kingdonia uniflora]|uniref:RRM domain-containing protein n=1 Tax=Kingdonia uniflora TaxID=39325 RepID=A0A7J7M9C0_9MAGN|nr:hypothetical protein GIB67_016299 [Kingdonia uniflora]
MRSRQLVRPNENLVALKFLFRYFVIKIFRLVWFLMEIENPQLDNETANYQDTDARGLHHQHSIGDQSENHSNISPDCVNSRGYDADEMSLRTSIPLSYRRKPSDTTTVAPDIASSSARARRLYVGNILYNIKGDQLGFVQFVRLQDTRAAQILNGQLDIGGRVIKVSAVSAHVGMQDIGAHTVDYDDD